jgi:hypothetical protein
VLFGAAAAGCAYAYLVAVPTRQVDELRAKLGTVNAEIAAARDAVEEVRELEQKSAGIRTQLGRDGRATTSPVLWVPDQMSKFFGQFGIEKVSTRENTGVPQPGLPGYQRSYWAVSFPVGQNATEVDKALLAVSELEATEPLVRVHSVAALAEAGREVLGGQSATVTVSLLTRKF